MDLQSVFAEAVLLHSKGELQKARERYLVVLERLPENVNILGNLSILHRDLGELDEALRIGQKAVSLAPHDPSQLLNLGAVHEALGNLAEARIMYEKVLAIAPKDPKALNNLGKIIHLQGNGRAALEYLKKAIEIYPDYPLALNNIGVILSEQGEHDTALQFFEKSYSLEPDDTNTLFNLAGVYNIAGRKEDALNMLESLVEIEPDHSSAVHMLAALKGEKTETAPPEYVVETFDRYANRFDAHLLQSLGYTVPVVLAEMVEKAEPGRFFDHCLDLGCGTGLSGEPFRRFAHHMTGVDLSSKMLEKAERKRIYDELHCQDILLFLDSCDKTYDLVVAADLFIYVGSLEAFFSSLGRCSSDGCLLACSIEGYSGDDGYTLRDSGRYAHSEQYLQDCARGNGFEIILLEDCNIRKEQERWIQGAVALFRKAKMTGK